MDVLSQKEMLARENEAFAAGIDAKSLMRAAGGAMARRIMALYPNASEYLILTSKGNNGGDGHVVAWNLIGTGKRIRVVLTTAEDQLTEAAKAMLDRLRRSASNLEIVTWNDDLEFPGSDGVVIDALLGIQANGALREPLSGIVAKTNAARSRNFFRTVTLDLPSGLAAYENGDAPQDRNAAIVADVTLAVGFAKEVLCRETSAAWVGRLEVVRWNDAQNSSASRQILVSHELAGLLPRRDSLSHKDDFGRLVIVAGSPGFTGAPILCAQAAQAMGAGLLSIMTRSDAYGVVAVQAPHEAMVWGWPQGDDIPTVIRNASAIVIGPGLSVDPEAVRMLRAILTIGCPVLIDADGLNALSQNPGLLESAKGPVILTPHPGEMARLIGRKFAHNERESVAREFVEKQNVTLVLKGTRTLITAPGKQLFINTSGNPGLSTGGSGDTLSGIVGSLLGRGLAPLDAARLGVWLHGHAADLALSARGCEEGLTPTMVSAHLGAALASLRSEAGGSIGLLERAKKIRPYSKD